MSLILRCPICGKSTTSHMEYNCGFARNIYDCKNCGWTNRYIQITIDTKTTPIDTYPSGIYYESNTTILKGGYKNARR